MNAPGRPLHRIAAAVGDTQKATLVLLRELAADGLAEPVGSERFWRLTAPAAAEYGEALKALEQEAA